MVILIKHVCGKSQDCLFVVVVLLCFVLWCCNNFISDDLKITVLRTLSMIRKKRMRTRHTFLDLIFLSCPYISIYSSTFFLHKSKDLCFLFKSLTYLKNYFCACCIKVDFIFYIGLTQCPKIVY